LAASLSTQSSTWTIDPAAEDNAAIGEIMAGMQLKGTASMNHCPVNIPSYDHSTEKIDAAAKAGLGCLTLHGLNS
jgi:hypothetical protein